MSRRRPDLKFPIAPVLEAEFDAHNVPRVVGGGHRKMLCPFHDEKDPSASVSEYGFVCFGCGVTGDAIKLLREQGGLTYADAVARCEDITGRTGGAVPRAGGWGGDLLGTSGD